MRSKAIVLTFLVLMLGLAACGAPRDALIPTPTLWAPTPEVEARTPEVEAPDTATVTATATATATAAATATATPPLPTLTAAAPEVEAPDEALVGPRWAWVAFQDAASGAESNDIVVSDPERYTLTFLADGTYEIEADCNQGQGTYTAEGGGLTIDPGPITLALCGPDSDADAFLNLLDNVVTYVFDDNGNLVLNLWADAGDMIFVPAAAVGEAPDWCRFAGTGATLAFEGQRANFTCEPETGSEVVLLGEIGPSDAGWTIDRAVLAREDEAFVVASLETVLVRHIELADGTTCAWAGTGATLAFDGKRANFTCDPEQVVLLGEVELSDAGWLIEKATIAHGDEGFTVADTEMVPIAGLQVERAEIP
jgi:heat shock protein HslJ